METTCYYSVIRYVPDPIRDEAKNIGVIVSAPEVGYSKAKFALSRAQLQPGSPRHQLLQSLIRGYQIQLSERPALPFGDVPAAIWGREQLLSLHTECTNLVQFTEPHVRIGDPSAVLDEVHRERVLPKVSGGSGRIRRLREEAIDAGYKKAAE